MSVVPPFSKCLQEAGPRELVVAALRAARRNNPEWVDKPWGNKNTYWLFDTRRADHWKWTEEGDSKPCLSDDIGTGNCVVPRILVNITLEGGVGWSEREGMWSREPYEVPHFGARPLDSYPVWLQKLVAADWALSRGGWGKAPVTDPKGGAEAARLAREVLAIWSGPEELRKQQDDLAFLVFYADKEFCFQKEWMLFGASDINDRVHRWYGSLNEAEDLAPVPSLRTVGIVVPAEDIEVRGGQVFVKKLPDNCYEWVGGRWAKPEETARARAAATGKSIVARAKAAGHAAVLLRVSPRKASVLFLEEKRVKEYTFLSTWKVTSRGVTSAEMADMLSNVAPMEVPGAVPYEDAGEEGNLVSCYTAAEDRMIQIASRDIAGLRAAGKTVRLIEAARDSYTVAGPGYVERRALREDGAWDSAWDSVEDNDPRMTLPDLSRPAAPMEHKPVQERMDW